MAAIELLAGGLVLWIILAFLIALAPLFIAHALYRMAAAHRLLANAYCTANDIQVPQAPSVERAPVDLTSTWNALGFVVAGAAVVGAIAFLVWLF